MKVEEFADQTLRKFLPPVKAEFTINHSRSVIKAAKDLAELKNIPLDTEELELAGWLHDIGRTKSEEEHAKFSLEIAKENYPINALVEDCILNHPSEATPTTQIGKIFQLSDKLSYFYPEFIEKQIELETKSGKPKEEVINKIKEQLTKYLDKFYDLDYLLVADKYYKEFLTKYFPGN